VSMQEVSDLLKKSRKHMTVAQIGDALGISHSSIFISISKLLKGNYVCKKPRKVTFTNNITKYVNYYGIAKVIELKGKCFVCNKIFDDLEEHVNIYHEVKK